MILMSALYLPIFFLRALFYNAECFSSSPIPFRPPVSVLYSADSEYNSALLSTNVIVTHDGNLTWLSSAIFKSSCGESRLQQPRLESLKKINKMLSCTQCRNQCWIFPVRRAKMFHEILQLDIRRLASECGIAFGIVRIFDTYGFTIFTI